ncbi:MAG: NAD-dependent epimerase/dehydratase family protein [Chitinivibrionales bacterium]|nr:NAD-dependent epimerase/dehydratase family protein [Chitinivibrionales bacterium]MBD3355663.1 NAD-dependent epimerase/dehydratase family protein [Chitinivibrionales bacterium]
MNLVTGCAGFIGFHVSSYLLERGTPIIGIDCVNDYYDPELKEARLKILNRYKDFTFYRFDLCDYAKLKEVFSSYSISHVCHLAAQAGVRYSLEHPFVYQKSNNEAFLNMLECVRHFGTKNFVYASSSSVYGCNTKLPFAEEDRTDEPISLYAATKKANELTAHVYSRLFGVPCSGLRFFTVYGPWGRPDMALFLFTKAILCGDTIDVYNHGKMKRNFTYIDDVVEGIARVLAEPRPYAIYNVGNSRAEELMDFIHEIEDVVGKKAVMNFMEMQPGDVPATVADISKLAELGYEPTTNIDVGIRRFVDWFREYYKM